MKNRKKKWCLFETIICQAKANQIIRIFIVTNYSIYLFFDSPCTMTKCGHIYRGIAASYMSRDKVVGNVLLGKNVENKKFKKQKMRRSTK